MSDEREISPRGDDSVPPDHMTPHEADALPNDQDDRFAQYDIAGFVLGALTDDETADIREAAARDPQLADEIAQMEIVVSGLAFAAAPQSINRGRSAGIRSRLISKAISTREKPPVSRRTAEIVRPMRSRETAAAPATPPISSAPVAREPRKAAPATSAPVARDTQSVRVVNISNQPRRTGWIVAGLMAAGLVAAVATEEWRMSQQRDQQGHVQLHQAQLVARVDSLQGTVAAKDSLIASLTGPNMKVVDLVNYQSLDPLARMFWDRQTQQWTMYAYNLRAPKPGKTYQVWLITKTSPTPISAGTFTPNPDGSATLRAKYGLTKDALLKVAVSEEPMGGVPSPTGPIIVAGAGR